MKELEPDYRMPDPSLTLHCEDVMDSIDRDITEFNAHGFTPAKKTEFENAIADFDAMPGDNYLLGQQEIATGEKNTARNNCEVKVREVLTGVENVWGVDSPQYHLFTENNPLSKLTDAELLRFMEDFADSTEDHLTDLAGEGIDAADVTELRGLRTTYNNKLKLQRKAIKARDTGNHARIKKGNELYKLLVKYCNTGKNIWLNVDESKYNDYVIYDSTNTHTVTVTLNLAPAQVGNFDISIVDPEKIVSGLFESITANGMYYAGTSPTAEPGATVLNVNAGESVSKTAAQIQTELGFDVTHTFMNAKNNGISAGTFKVTLTVRN